MRRVVSTLMRGTKIKSENRGPFNGFERTEMA